MSVYQFIRVGFYYTKKITLLVCIPFVCFWYVLEIDCPEMISICSTGFCRYMCHPVECNPYLDPRRSQHIGGRVCTMAGV